MVKKLTKKETEVSLAEVAEKTDAGVFTFEAESKVDNKYKIFEIELSVFKNGQSTALLNILNELMKIGATATEKDSALNIEETIKALVEKFVIPAYHKKYKIEGERVFATKDEFDTDMITPNAIKSFLTWSGINQRVDELLFHILPFFKEHMEKSTAATNKENFDDVLTKQGIR